METTFVQPDVAMMNPGGNLEEDEIKWLIDEIGKLFFKKVPVILLDFSSVDRLRSSSAAVIMGLVGIAREKGSSVAIVSPTEQVQEVFEMLGAEKIMPIFPGVEEAVKNMCVKKPDGD